VTREGLQVMVLQPDLINRAHLGASSQQLSSLPWRECYQTRTHLLIAWQRRALGELGGWTVRLAKFLLADCRSRAGRRRAGFRLRGAMDGLKGVTGRSLDPATGGFADRTARGRAAA
jgi:hypothetical protein